MMEVSKNLLAAILVLKLYRKKYKQCRGDNIYACYNGGQGWGSVSRECLEECSGPSCNACERPARYRDSVIRHIKFLKKKYYLLIITLHTVDAEDVPKESDGEMR